MRATAVRPAGSWREKPADSVVLDYDDRHRRRMAMTSTRGIDFLLDLAEATALRTGDALVLEDGRLIEVVAAPEQVLEIRGRDPQHLVRLAWHLGNRHLPTQIGGKYLRIRQDHVIADMLRGLGAQVVALDAPFDPESGAYAAAGSNAHPHAHAHEQAHAHPPHTHADGHHGHADDHHHEHHDHCDHHDHAGHNHPHHDRAP